MRLKYKVSLILVVLSILVCLMTYQSYALWIKDIAAQQENKIEVGCFEIGYEDNNTTIELTNTYPVSNTKGLTSSPYKFTITNKCSIADKYTVTLNTSNTNNYEAGSVVTGCKLTPGEESIPTGCPEGKEITEAYEAFNMKNKVKFALSKGDSIVQGKDQIHNLGEFANTPTNINEDKTELTKYVTDIEESIILDTGTLKEGESVTYNLYLWFDAETAKNEIMGKSFNASVNVIHHATSSDNNVPNVEENRENEVIPNP